MKNLQFTKSIIRINLWIVLLSVSLSNFFTHAQPFKLFGVSDLVRVFEDGYNLPPLNDALNLFGIRNEIISGQFIVNSSSKLTNVTIEINPLKHQGSGDLLPSNSIEWNFTGSIPIQVNAVNQSPTVVTREAPAKFPDYLVPERKLDINKGVYQSVWLTITIPKNAKEGLYEGKISVKTGQGEKFLPLYLTVYPLTLPTERNLKITEWYSTHHFKKFHGITEQYSPEWFVMLQKYAENMAQHRQNVFQVPMNAIQIKKTKNGSLEFDFTHFDQIAQTFWNTGKMDYMETGELARFKENWFSTEIILKDFSVTDADSREIITLPGQEVMPYLMPAFEAHLREKGWLNKTFFHIKDEPILHNAASWLEMSRYVHKYAPDLIRIDAMNNPIIMNELEIGVAMVDNMDIQYERFREKQKEGKELWIYTTGLFQATSYPNKTLDVPLIGSRVLHWLNYKYDLSGYLHWGWNQWTNDPYTNVGQHLGDGWHVYPVKDGVLNSLRWEQMRNGIQDYEYFVLLENRINSLKDSLGKRFDWIEPSYRSKEIAAEVVASFSEYTEDPEILYKAKEKIVRELLDFDLSPKVYVQIHPPENSVLKNRSGVEVYGWVEPGTKITINKERIPVTNEGLFMKWLTLYFDNNKIIIKATNEKGSKEIIRPYNIIVP